MGRKVRSSSGRSVVSHLAWTLGVCLSALAVLVVTTSITSFDRERRRVSSELGSAARLTADELAEELQEIVSFVVPIAGQASLRRFDADSCSDAFAGFASFLADSGHVHLLEADGREVCSVGETEAGSPFPVGDWLGRVLASGRPESLDPADDPLSGRLAQTTIVPVAGNDGRTGVLVAVLYVGVYDVEVPKGLPESTEVMLLDPDRTRVAVTSPNADRLVGRSLAGTGLDSLETDKTATVPGFDGRERLAFAVDIPGSNLTVVVSLRTSAAFSAARKQLNQTLVIGALSVLVIGALGLSLHGRLTRPLRRLTSAIRAAGRGEARRRRYLGARPRAGRVGRDGRGLQRNARRATEPGGRPCVPRPARRAHRAPQPGGALHGTGPGTRRGPDGCRPLPRPRPVQAHQRHPRSQRRRRPARRPREAADQPDPLGMHRGALRGGTNSSFSARTPTRRRR